MRDNIVIADSVAHLPEMAAWYSVIKEELGTIDTSKLLVYIIDSVDAVALPYLAEQLDVLGYKGWKLATTEADQRELLKRSIELHKYKGTVWAIKEALKSIGFDSVTVNEGIAAGYDHWAKFGIELTNQNVQLNSTQYQDILAMVREYKNARSHLEEILITLFADDVLDISVDDSTAEEMILSDDLLLLTGALFRDGTADYDGTWDHSGDSDVATIT
jgi:phage tail P2-like protein